MIHKNARKLISFLEHSNTQVTILLVLAVIILGSIYSFYLGNDLRYPDEWDYYKIATNLVSHHKFSLDGELPTSFRAPGYPFILAFFLLFGANIIHLRIFNFAVLGFSIYLLNATLKQHSTPFSATIGCLLAIGYPVFFYTAGALYPQTFASSLLLLTIYFLGRDANSYWVYLLCGAFFGWLLLTIPIFAFLLIVFPFWYWYSKKNLSKQR